MNHNPPPLAQANFHDSNNNEDNINQINDIARPQTGPSAQTTSSGIPNNSANNIKDERIIKEQGLEKEIAQLVLPLLSSLNFALIRVKMLGKNGTTLQIMAEPCGRPMTVDDCEKLSKLLSPTLDASNLINHKYHLEISSPGIDRPLVRIEDFIKYQLALVKIEAQLLEGKKRYRAILKKADDKAITLEMTPNKSGDKEEITIPYEALLTAKLVLTDELIKAALKGEITH